MDLSAKWLWLQCFISWFIAATVNVWLPLFLWMISDGAAGTKYEFTFWSNKSTNTRRLLPELAGYYLCWYAYWSLGNPLLKWLLLSNDHGDARCGGAILLPWMHRSWGHSHIWESQPWDPCLLINSLPTRRCWYFECGKILMVDVLNISYKISQNPITDKSILV